MFPITHIYAIRKLIRDSGKDHHLGSVFPDIAITGTLNRRDTHYNWKTVCSKINNKAFCLGYKSHNLLDRLCDEDPLPRMGYAFRHSKPLIDDVRAFGLGAFLAKVRAHNFIEYAMEKLLVSRYPYLMDMLDEAMDVDEDLLSELESFFKVSLREPLKRYFSYIPRDEEGFRKVFLIKDNLDVDKKSFSRVVRKAEDIIKHRFLDDMDLMIAKVRL